MIAHEEPLHLIGDAVALPGQLAVVKTQRRDAGLQTMLAAIAGLGDGHQDARHLDVAQFIAAGRDVFEQPADMAAKIERLTDVAADQPGRGRLSQKAVARLGACSVRAGIGLVALVPAQHKLILPRMQ